MPHEIPKIEISQSAIEDNARMPYEYVVKHARENGITLPFDEKTYEIMSDDDYEEIMRILMNETVKNDQPKESIVQESPQEPIADVTDKTTDHSVNHGRRKFLKGAALVGLTAAVGGTSVLLKKTPEEKISDNTKKKSENAQNNNTSNPQENLRKNADEVAEAPTQINEVDQQHVISQEKVLNVKKEDEKISGEEFIKQVRESNDGHINVESAKKAIYEKYYELYGLNGAYHDRMMRGLHNSSQWLSEIKKYAEEESLSVGTMLAIAIGESYVEKDAASYRTKANGQREILARGPFQIIRSTAQRSMKKLGAPLHIEEGYDERCDHAKAGRSAAKLLKFNYDYFDQDLSIAKTGYNGWSKARDFKKMCRKENVECTYKNFNQWLETEINNEIDTIRKQQKRTYTIGAGDTIEKISIALHIPEKKLRAYNNIPPNDSAIVAGDILQLPMNRKAFERDVKVMFHKKWKQNFVYPEKINAIEQMLTDTKILDNLPRNEVPYKEYPVPQAEVTHTEYTIQPGDTLSKIAQSIAMRHSAQGAEPISSSVIKTLLRKDNPTIITGTSDAITAGKTLHINLPLSQPLSLQQIARQQNTPLDVLQKLNPAVLKTDIPLPDGISLRIPQSA